MATEPLTGSRIPDLTFAPDISQLGTAVRDLADNTLPQFATTGARDSAYSAWVSSGYTMRDGLWCTVGTKLYQYVLAATAWVEMGDAGATTTFIPTWVASFSAATVGNGSLTGRYRKVGRLCWFSIVLTMGSTTNPGLGLYSFTGLPFTSAAYEQQVVAKTSTTAGTLRNWAGFGYIQASTTTAVPFFANNASPQSYNQCQQTDGAGTTGTGVPFVSGTNPYTNGSNIIIQGTYETAS